MIRGCNSWASDGKCSQTQVPNEWCVYNRKKNCPAPPPPPSPLPAPPPPQPTCPGVSVANTWYTGYTSIVWGPEGQKPAECAEWCLGQCTTACYIRKDLLDGADAFCGFRYTNVASGTGMCASVAGANVGKVPVAAPYYTSEGKCIIDLGKIYGCRLIPPQVCEKNGVSVVEATTACMELLNSTRPECSFDDCIYDYCALGGAENLAGMAASCLGINQPNPPLLPPPSPPPSTPPPAAPPPPGTCKDDPSYRDPSTGWTCQDWKGFPCRSGQPPRFSTVAQIDALVQACPESCTDVVPECRCHVCDLVSFDFSTAKVTANNFDGQGVRSHPAEIRYKEVATYEGRKIDLVMTSRRNAYCGKSGRTTTSDACLEGGGEHAPHWGGIGVTRGQGNELYIRLTLRYTSDNTEAVVPVFCLTFTDIGRGDGPIEYLTVAGYGAPGGADTTFATYALGADLRVESGISLWQRPALRFRPSTNKGMPNPHFVSPMKLSADQRAASVRIHFENTGHVDLVWGTLYQTGCCQRMWFAGNSLVEGPCPEITPNPSPPPPSPPPVSPSPPKTPIMTWCTQSATSSGGFGCSNTPYIAEGGRGDVIHPLNPGELAVNPRPPAVQVACELPPGTEQFSVIVKEDARLAAHSFYRGISVGGTLYDASAQESATVGSSGQQKSYVGGLLYGNRWSWKGGLVRGKNPYFDFSYFESLVSALRPAYFGQYTVKVYDQGGSYSAVGGSCKRFSGSRWGQAEVREPLGETRTGRGRQAH